MIYDTLVNAKHKPDVFVFATLMKACLRNGFPHDVSKVTKEMEKYNVLPNEVCLKILIKVYLKTKDILAKTVLHNMSRKEVSSK